MPARITRAHAVPRYTPPLHDGVDAHRLQGMEAGPTGAFWVGLSVYQPGGAARMSPTARETVYVVLDGAFVLTVDGTEEVLGPGDSVHLPQGTVRTVENRGSAPARLLVVIATAAEGTS